MPVARAMGAGGCMSPRPITLMIFRVWMTRLSVRRCPKRPPPMLPRNHPL
jgi:hypothetical protein